MPKVSTNGPKNQVTPVFGVDNPGPSYTFAGDDTYASVQAAPNDPTPLTPSIPLPVGATIQLPGPRRPHTSLVIDNTDLPSGGDYYKVADPRGRIGLGVDLTIDGGGYPILGAPTLVLDVDYAEAEFTFDDTAQAWIACVCNQGGG
jgi:hypothetical protein